MLCLGISVSFQIFHCLKRIHNFLCPPQLLIYLSPPSQSFASTWALVYLAPQDMTIFLNWFPRPKLFSFEHSCNILFNSSLLISCPNLSLSFDVNMFGTSLMKLICDPKDVSCAECWTLKCVTIIYSIDIYELNMFLASSLILPIQLIYFLTLKCVWKYLVFLSPTSIHVSLHLMQISSSMNRQFPFSYTPIRWSSVNIPLRRIMGPKDHWNNIGKCQSHSKL